MIETPLWPQLPVPTVVDLHTLTRLLTEQQELFSRTNWDVSHRTILSQDIHRYHWLTRVIVSLPGHWQNTAIKSRQKACILYHHSIP